MRKCNIMDSEIAIRAEHISKTFLIPHEVHDTFRERLIHFEKKKKYELFEALKDISFEIKKGEFFGIIGRNGSGKSTLLKILAGIYTPDNGKITINGEVSPFLELGVGFNPELSGRDNIYLNGTILGLSKQEIRSKFDSIVDFSELDRFIDQKLKNYSSGMQVRLAFAVAIHANKGILLMDEVLAVGDSNFQSKCITEFNRFKNDGKTVILVTHDIPTVQRSCERAMLLNNGIIIKIGKSEEVCTEYMYQNMSDEERNLNKRIKEINKIINSNEIIRNFQLLNSIGEEINTIKTYDNLEIKVSFNTKNIKDKKLNLGISFESEEGVNLFGYNTEMDGFIIDSEKNILNLLLPNLLLLKGNYFINVTVVDMNDNKLIDFKPKIKKITVFTIDKEMNYKGYFSLEHTWVQ